MTAEPTAPPTRRAVAVVGASGYVGRLLTRHLTDRGQPVVAVGRHLDRLPQGPDVDPRPADIADVDAAARALSFVDVAYYLVHAMAGGDRFADRDRATARAFADAARRAGVRRIVYLGGLGTDATSAHLSSRHEVGRLLRGSGIPVVELRAGVVLGAGSISFEMLRCLTERLPVMVCPRWIDTRLQPLSEDDVLEYLRQAATAPPGIYEIGTPDVTTYHDMMQTYASIRGLRRRLIVKVPLLTPSLSAHWVDLVTPVDRAVSHALIESLRHEVTVADPSAADVFTVRPQPTAAAIRAALDAQSTAVAQQLLQLPDGDRDGISVMRSAVELPAEQAAAVGAGLADVGGDLGWYGLAWAWRLRLALGRLVGERTGLRRPDPPGPPVAGSVVDWWTVVRIDPRALVLATTSWWFGDGWLGYRITQESGRRRARLEIVAAFRPRGITGLAYWRLLRPVHRLVLRRMARHRIAHHRTVPAPPVSKEAAVRDLRLSPRPRRG